MSVPAILQYKQYVPGDRIGIGDFVVSAGSIIHWNHPTDPQPTQAQLDAWAAEPGFQTWLDEHGRNAALTVRREAKERLVALQDDAVALRAVVLLIVDEINLLRQWITSFKAATAAATSLINLKSGVAALPNVPNRTAIAVRTEIIAKITAGGADT